MCDSSSLRMTKRCSYFTNLCSPLSCWRRKHLNSNSFYLSLSKHVWFFVPQNDKTNFPLLWPIDKGNNSLVTLLFYSLCGHGLQIRLSGFFILKLTKKIYKICFFVYIIIFFYYLISIIYYFIFYFCYFIFYFYYFIFNFCYFIFNL